MTLPEKFNFLEGDLNDSVNKLSEHELYMFFKEIILDETINENIRKRMLATLTDCVMLEKIRTRHALNLLVDEWKVNSEIFLQIQRLKDLYYYFNEEKDKIQKIYLANLKDEEAEIISESAFNLGLISLQESFNGKTKEEIIQYLNTAESYFFQASEIIENRIDASFYKTVVRILIDMYDQLWGNVNNNLKKVANYFYQKEAFSFNDISNPFYLGFYRVLNSLSLTTQEKPENWLDTREGLHRLYVQYAEINNQQLKQRLNQSVVASSFLSIVNNEFIEPYYARNFSSQIEKIDIRLSELDASTEEYAFLTYIKSLPNQELKKN